MSIVSGIFLCVFFPDLFPMALSVVPYVRLGRLAVCRTFKRGVRRRLPSPVSLSISETATRETQRDSTSPLTEADFQGANVSRHYRWKRRPKVGEILQNSTTYLDLQSSVAADDWATPLYPKSNFYSEQAKFSYRPKVDPRETSIILFPGQGTHYVGMGKNLMKFPNVKQLYNHASEILGYDLYRLCCEGPVSELSRTVCSQPAIFVSSLASLEQLREERPKAIENCVATAGYSVGEYAALVFSGAITFESAIYLVKVRSVYMLICRLIE